MTRMKYILFAALLGLVVSCGSKDASAKKENEVVKTNVEIAVVHPQQFSNFLETIGIVTPAKDVPVLAEEGGTLARILVDKGNTVHKGELIAVLSNNILTAQLKQAKAAYQSDSLNYEQQKELTKVSGISEVALKQAQYRRDMSRANYDVLRSRYAKLYIKAPVSGLLDQRFYDIGRYVTPMSPFCHVIDIAHIKVTVDIPERFVDLVNKKNEVFVNFDALNKRGFESKISFIGNVIDAKTRTFPVEIKIDNPESLLKPNMVANVRVQLYTLSKRMVIPNDAIVDDGEDQIAFIKNGPYAISKKLAVEDIYRENALINKGLSFGDSLIVLGNRDLVDSTLINVTKIVEN